MNGFRYGHFERQWTLMGILFLLGLYAINWFPSFNEFQFLGISMNVILALSVIPAIWIVKHNRF